MNRKIGFIGSGNMAVAIIGGIINSGFASPDEVYSSNRTMPKLMDVKVNYGIQIADNNKEIAETCDVVFLSVKPDTYESVIEEIHDSLNPNAIVVLIAAGQTIAENEARLPNEMKVIKAMPNTPALVGEGLTSISINDYITDQDKMYIKELFESIGEVEFIDEELMDVASAIGGSSPAFVYMYIEALADAAVLKGMPRDQAYKIAAQATLGAAKMVAVTDEHPGKLKDDVCSPGGSTIQSVASLEEHGFRNAIIQAVKSNVKKLEK
ncbi:pyrroline-5-carboxylate reductase [Ornithinibacillus halophilus]|uniref:Pyrroline-5-carboxylate reductase n=1 Tax=Ornithinibacillus halophilus TaxID=930117 RepID=A0A1M5IK16_9BACI|nr:pyrroline-5-carboxylate reductase [Ornithinibacillus halophilus]SHG28585.1 pyrroline-5-carboxylate reductase [Ornithinibacillus halophilus]